MAFAIAVLSFVTGPLRAAEPDNLYWPDGDGTAGNDSYFGRTIDFDGELLVIGAPGASAAYVFQSESQEWQHVATLATPMVGPWNGEMKVAVDGDVIAVGAGGATVDGITRAGLVYVFAQGETAAEWQEVARLTSDTPIVEGRFGMDVAFEDGRILVSCWSPNDPAGYLFEQNAAGEWLLVRTFSGADGSGLVVDDVAIDGDRIVFGHDETGAYVYERSAAGWVLSEFIPVPGARTVALEGDVLVVGAPFEPIGEAPRFEGVAHVFERADGEWQQVARLYSPRGDALGYFGTRMDMQDGLLVVGEGHETGAVHAFRKNEAGEWVGFADSFKGSMHATVHVPAISASTMAIGYSVVNSAGVELFSVAELLSETETVEDPGNVNDDPDSDGNDPAGDASGANPGSDDSAGTAGSDGDTSNGGTTNSLAGGGNMAGTEPAAGASAGGGAMGCLAALLALLGKRKRGFHKAKTDTGKPRERGLPA